MLTKSDIKLGTRIHFSRAYSINPKIRLNKQNGVNAAELDRYDMDKIGKYVYCGIIVGYRNYIMSNYSRWCDYDCNYVVGDVKRMLLVAYDINRKHILVDPADAELIIEGDRK